MESSSNKKTAYNILKQDYKKIIDSKFNSIKSKYSESRKNKFTELINKINGEMKTVKVSYENAYNEFVVKLDGMFPYENYLNFKNKYEIEFINNHLLEIDEGTIEFTSDKLILDNIENRINLYKKAVRIFEKNYKREQEEKVDNIIVDDEKQIEMYLNITLEEYFIASFSNLEANIVFNFYSKAKEDLLKEIKEIAFYLIISKIIEENDMMDFEIDDQRTIDVRLKKIINKIKNEIDNLEKKFNYSTEVFILEDLQKQITKLKSFIAKIEENYNKKVLFINSKMNNNPSDYEPILNMNQINDKCESILCKEINNYEKKLKLSLVKNNYIDNKMNLNVDKCKQIEQNLVATHHDIISNFKLSNYSSMLSLHYAEYYNLANDNNVRSKLKIRLDKLKKVNNSNCENNDKLSELLQSYNILLNEEKKLKQNEAIKKELENVLGKSKIKFTNNDKEINDKLLAIKKKVKIDLENKLQKELDNQ